MREIELKIALVGPLGAGKRTISNIFFPMAEPRGKPQWTEPTSRALQAGALFFDFIAPKLVVRGRPVRVAIHTTMEPDEPEALAYALDRAHAIVFVADSTRRDANIAAMKRLDGRRPNIFIFNKRDCANIASTTDLALDLDVGTCEVFEGIATQKIGVVDGFKAAVKVALGKPPAAP